MNTYSICIYIYTILLIEMLREDKGSQLFGGTARWARLCAIAGELPRGAVVSRRWIKGKRGWQREEKLMEKWMDAYAVVKSAMRFKPICCRTSKSIAFLCLGFMWIPIVLV